MSSYFVHESSFVDEPSAIGAGTRIWHFSHVMSGATIGANCVLGQNVFVADGVSIGSGVKIQNNVSVYKGCTIEDDVFLGPSCVLTNVINPRSAVERKDEFRPSLIKRGATVGANATVVCGTTVGEFAFVGAGSVVTSDVPAYALVVGVPARIMGWMCACGVKLDATDGRASCSSCGRAYRLSDGVCAEDG